MTTIDNTKIFHPFNRRLEKLPLLKKVFIPKEESTWIENDLEEQKKHNGEIYTWKLADEVRQKAKLAVIYYEEKIKLKYFLNDVIEISLKKGDWRENPESQLNKIITKHTTNNFNPKNFLNHSYNSKNGSVFQSGLNLFFGQHNIDEAKKLLGYLEESN